MGWDLEAVQIECCEKTSVMMMGQVMVEGLGWTLVDSSWVHRHSHPAGALLLCALYAHLCCESVVDSGSMGG